MKSGRRLRAGNERRGAAASTSGQSRGAGCGNHRGVIATGGAAGRILQGVIATTAPVAGAAGRNFTHRGVLGVLATAVALAAGTGGRNRQSVIAMAMATRGARAEKS